MNSSSVVQHPSCLDPGIGLRFVDCCRMGLYIYTWLVGFLFLTDMPISQSYKPMNLIKVSEMFPHRNLVARMALPTLVSFMQGWPVRVQYLPFRTSKHGSESIAAW